MQSNNPKLILDIETSGFDFETLDTFSQEHIKKYAESTADLQKAKDRLGFSPLTGEIVAIGLLDSQADKGTVLVQSSGKTIPAEIEGGIKIIGGTEAEIIKEFWKIAQTYTTFVTFNGRGFDMPFLMVRSAVHEIKPTKNLLSNRYLSLQNFAAKHIDLFDQLGFYGASQVRSSLHFWAKAFGIPSPKDGGVTGDDVSRLFKEGKILEIAKYNSKDLFTTKALFDKWEKYLNI